MKFFSLALTLLISVYTATSYAATLVQFHSDPQAREMKFVNDIYGDFLKTRPLIRLETAVVDLSSQVDSNGKKIGLILVRFNDPSMCTDSGCYTKLLKYNGSTWKEVFSHTTKTIAIGDRSPQAWGGNGMLDLIVNGRETWIWTGFGQYTLLFSSVGKVVDPTGKIKNSDGKPFDTAGGVAPAAIANAAAGVLYEFAQKRPTSASPIHFFATPLDIGPNKAWMVEAQASDICGSIGCPVTVLYQQKDGTYRSLLVSYINELAAVLPSVDDKTGMHDLLFNDMQGYHIERFDNGSYKDIYTSYPSKFTAIP